MAQPLPDADIQEALRDLPEWTRDGDAIQREFRFPDFARAFAFMTACALRAEQANHHPDWSNRYNTVRVRLSTHDCGGITRRDIDLARAMDALSCGQSGGRS